MNLDWGFYYDSWLIDKIPDVIDIKIEEHPSGIVFNPPELEFYFGANPIYLYGEGKHLHEVLFCPDGIAIYPTFLGRPGFEFIDEVSFSAGFDGDIEKHVGYIGATDYMHSILDKLYGVSPSDFMYIKTPSSRLRYTTEVDISMQDTVWNSEAVFYDASDMANFGCKFYANMSVNDGESGIKNEINGEISDVNSPGAIILNPGLFYDAVFLKYSYIEAPSEIVDLIGATTFHLMFTTLPNFRYGTLFDFGATSNAIGPNYGFKLKIYSDHAMLYINDGNMNRFEILYNDEIDFRFPHRWKISREGDTISVSIDGDVYLIKKDTGIGAVLYNKNYKNYISGSYANKNINTPAGDIEELAIFNRMPDSDERDMNAFYNGSLPLLKRGGVNQSIVNNTPAILSYGLTYDKPTYVFIPNFFGGEFDKFYIKNWAGDVKVITDGEKLADYYITDMIPIKNKSIKLPLGYNIYNVITKNQEPLFSQDIPSKMPVLTKLTSDTHIPIKVKIKFKLPFFYSIPTTYNISINMKALSKFMVYSYRRFKTGEYI